MLQVSSILILPIHRQHPHRPSSPQSRKICRLVNHRSSTSPRNRTRHRPRNPQEMPNQVLRHPISSILHQRPLRENPTFSPLIQSRRRRVRKEVRVLEDCFPGWAHLLIPNLRRHRQLRPLRLPCSRSSNPGKRRLVTPRVHLQYHKPPQQRQLRHQHPNLISRHSQTKVLPLPRTLLLLLPRMLQRLRSRLQPRH